MEMFTHSYYVRVSLYDTNKIKYALYKTIDNYHIYSELCFDLEMFMKSISIKIQSVDKFKFNNMHNKGKHNSDKCVNCRIITTIKTKLIANDNIFYAYDMQEIVNHNIVPTLSVSSFSEIIIISNTMDVNTDFSKMVDIGKVFDKVENYHNNNRSKNVLIYQPFLVFNDVGFYLNSLKSTYAKSIAKFKQYANCNAALNDDIKMQMELHANTLDSDVINKCGVIFECEKATKNYPPEYLSEILYVLNELHLRGVILNNIALSQIIQCGYKLNPLIIYFRTYIELDKNVMKKVGLVAFEFICTLCEDVIKYKEEILNFYEDHDISYKMNMVANILTIYSFSDSIINGDTIKKYLMANTLLTPCDYIIMGMIK